MAIALTFEKIIAHFECEKTNETLQRETTLDDLLEKGWRVVLNENICNEKELDSYNHTELTMIEIKERKEYH